MNGYAAAARIRSVSPHLVAGTTRHGESLPLTIAVELDDLLVTTTDDEPARSTSGLAERWMAARERWSQLTFYLTDANSWR